MYSCVVYDDGNEQWNLNSKYPRCQTCTKNNKNTLNDRMENLW